MHIASALTLVRRDSAQSDAAVPFLTPRMRKLLPGAILLTVLAVIGGLFPILF